MESTDTAQLTALPVDVILQVIQGKCQQEIIQFLYRIFLLLRCTSDCTQFSTFRISTSSSDFLQPLPQGPFYSVTMHPFHPPVPLNPSPPAAVLYRQHRHSCQQPFSAASIMCDKPPVHQPLSIFLPQFPAGANEPVPRVVCMMFFFIFLRFLFLYLVNIYWT